MDKRVYSLVLLVLPVLTLAYQQQTHVELTRRALNISVLANDESLLADLALEVFGGGRLFPEPDTGDLLTIGELVENGADYEDGKSLFDAIKRTSNHFLIQSTIAP